MKKEILIKLEVEVEENSNIDDTFIEKDLKQEINCCSLFYEVKDITIS